MVVEGGAVVVVVVVTGMAVTGVVSTGEATLIFAVDSPVLAGATKELGAATVGLGVFDAVLVGQAFGLLEHVAVALLAPEADDRVACEPVFIRTTTTGTVSAAPAAIGPRWRRRRRRRRKTRNCGFGLNDTPPTGVTGTTPVGLSRAGGPSTANASSN